MCFLDTPDDREKSSCPPRPRASPRWSHRIFHPVQPLPPPPRLLTRQNAERPWPSYIRRRSATGLVGRESEAVRSIPPPAIRRPSRRPPVSALETLQDGARYRAPPDILPPATSRRPWLR